MTMKKKSLFGILLSLTVMLALILGMSMTAMAETQDSDPAIWSEDKQITSDKEITGDVTFNNDMTLLIPEGRKQVVHGRIYAPGKTLTVRGKGTLTVDPGDADAGDGTAGFTGNILSG